MKRFWKMIFWIAGVLAALGFVLGSIGVVLGGREEIVRLRMSPDRHIVLTNPAWQEEWETAEPAAEERETAEPAAEEWETAEPAAEE